MASLIIKSAGFDERVIPLDLGVNRFGRSPRSAVQIDHPTVSANHCEIVLTNDGVVVRDKGSTNGTFVGGKRIEEAKLLPGQLLRLGDVELLVDSTDVTVAIPNFEPPRQHSLLVTGDRALVCAWHPETPATHRCTGCGKALCRVCGHRGPKRRGRVATLCMHCDKPAEVVCSLHCGNRATIKCTRCHRVFCDGCARKLRRSGGKILKLCPACSQECTLICPRHPEARALYRCTHCHVAVCQVCARRRRHPTSISVRICPICRHPAHLFCPRHPEERATHYCTHCNELLCNACVQQLRGRHGAILKFCCHCDHPCKPFAVNMPEKKSLLDLLQATVGLRLGGKAKAAKRRPRKKPHLS